MIKPPITLHNMPIIQLLGSNEITKNIINAYTPYLKFILYLFILILLLMKCHRFSMKNTKAL